MALLDDLVAKVEANDLKAELAAAVQRLKKTRQFASPSRRVNAAPRG